MRRPRKFYRNISRFIWEQERVILALLAIVIVVSGSIWYGQFNKSDQSPNSGGTYNIGIVGDKKNLQMVTNRLTKAGLFKVNKDGGLDKLLISDYQVSSDQLKYTFNLVDGIDPNEISGELQKSADLFGEAAITTEGRNIVMTLPSSNPDLPLLLAQPLFNYGPYKIVKSNGQMTVYTKNTKAHSVSAYLNKVVVYLYDNNNQLEKAYNDKKIDGGEDTQGNIPNIYQEQSINYPRYYAVFFNLNKSPFRDPSFRQNLIDGNSVTGDVTLISADQEPYRSLAQQIVKRWQDQGLKVQLELKPWAEFTDKVITPRNFQAVLSGMDYGMEDDPYYFWHSSQIRPPGNNLTGLKSQAVDQIIDQIRATLNVNQRNELIKSLHAQLAAEGAVIIISEQTDEFILSNNIHWMEPWLSTSIYDQLQNIDQWYLK